MVGIAAKGEAVMSAAKQEILARIRTGLKQQGRDRTWEYGSIVRAYEQSGGLDREGRLALFTERLEDYGAEVHRCGEEDVAPASFHFVEDRNLPYSEIDSSEGVLTMCVVAIAMTGTIVLRHSSEEGRRALTLIPDYHLCVVRESQVVETVAEGIRLMRGFYPFPITTISGPSATSDIEMTRIKGVHGPRILEVILAAD
jgi:L-lactate dehydrogenase complex protein LldG